MKPATDITFAAADSPALALCTAFRLMALAAALMAAALFLTGCASSNAPSLAYKQALDARMDTHDFQYAEALVEESKESQYGQRNAVLYWIDQAALLHDLGRYEESDAALDSAERRIEELFTRDSSKAAQRYFVNDATEDFKGEPYVRTLLHIYRALNALFLKKRDDAAVEARKVTRYLQDLQDDQTLKTSYRDDAFAHLLSALALSDAGDLDSALLSLRQARKAYTDQASLFDTPMPQAVLQNLLADEDDGSAHPAPVPKTAALDYRTLKLVRTDELQAAQPQAPQATEQEKPQSGATAGTSGTSAPAEAQASAPSGTSDTSATAAPSAPPVPEEKPPQEGEFVFIHFAGKMPLLVERRIQVAGDRAGIYVREHPEELHGRHWSETEVAALSGESFVIALPDFSPRPSMIQKSSVWCTDGSCAADTELVSNLAMVAERTFSEQLDEITARAGARVAIKFAITKVAQAAAYVAAKSSKSQASQYADVFAGLVGAIGRAASAATEAADTRSWLTAPAQIRMARVRLKPGTHDIRIFFKDARGSVISQYDFKGVFIRPGRRTYEHLRTAY